MLRIMLIGTGGFIVARYLMSGLAHRFISTGSSFPYGTLLGNSLFIGLFSGLVETRQLFNPEVRLFVLIGLLGGLPRFQASAMRPLRC